MRYLSGVLVFLGVVGLACGQQHSGPYWSVGGYGNVLYPGTGHAPGAVAPAGTNFGRPAYGPRAGVATHPAHGRSVIVPYPVYYGGFGYDPSLYYGQGYAPGYADPSQQGPGTYPMPSVVINQTFVPPQANPVVREYGTPDANGEEPQSSGLKLYQAPSHPYADVQAAQAASDQPTLVLIAFKDHTIVQALGYWMEGSTLHYVSVERTLNQASLDLIDRDLSMRLNNERGVEFKIPAR